MKIVCLLFAGILLFAKLSTANIFAQDLGGALQNQTRENNARFALPQDIQTKLDALFEAMVKKDYRNGLEKFMLNSPISRKDNDFANILRELGKAIDLYGDIKGYEIVDFRVAGSSFFRVNIIGLHQRYPTRWEINFYRSPSMGLIVTNFKLDDIAELYLD